LVAKTAGEFDHGGFAEENGSGVVQVLDDRGVVVEDLIHVGLGAPGGGNIFHREKIFGGVRDAVERAPVMATMDFFFGSLRLIEGDRVGDASVGVELGSEFSAALEIALGEFDRRKLLGLNLLGEFADGGKKDRFFKHARWRSILFGCGERFGLRLAFNERFQIESRGVAILQIEFANAFEGGLKIGAHFLDIGFLRVIEMASVETEELLVARVGFELTLWGELGGGASGLRARRRRQKGFGWRESSGCGNDGGTMSELSAGQ